MSFIKIENITETAVRLCGKLTLMPCFLNLVSIASYIIRIQYIHIYFILLLVMYCWLSSDVGNNRNYETNTQLIKNFIKIQSLTEGNKC